MLKKKERLDRVSFNRFFSAGKRLHSPSLMLIYAPHEQFKVSAVVSKKIAKTAVLRNKFRRRIYNTCARLTKTERPSGVCIIIAKDGAIHMPYQTLTEELHELIHKTHALR
jgi:ribonuclease P protein component